MQIFSSTLAIVSNIVYKTPVVNRTGIIGIIVFSLSMLSSLTSAQSSAVIVPKFGGHAQVANAKKEDVAKAVKAQLDLEGYNVMSAGMVEAQLPSTLADCNDDGCVAKIRAAMKADLAATIYIWGRTDNPTEWHQVVVALADESESYSGAAEQVGAETILQVAARAAQLAVSRRKLGPGPYLSFDGLPNGASVFLDGKEVGSLPLQLKSEGGLHSVKIVAEGYVTHEEEIQLAADENAMETVSVKLSRDIGVSENGDELLGNDSGTSWKTWAGLGLVGVGVAAAVLPVMAFAKDGDCKTAGSHATSCRELHSVNASTYVLLGLSGLAVLGGVSLMLWPEDSGHDATTSFKLNWQTNF